MTRDGGVGTGGVGEIDRAYISMDQGTSQELIGNGFIQSSKEEIVCTSKKLIATAIGSGPLYDITLDEEIEQEHRRKFDDRPVEAIIEYSQKIEKPELNRDLLGGETFAFSPSMINPNYTQVDISSPDENGRVLKSQLSGDGSTLVLLTEYAQDRVFPDQELPRETKLTVYKRDGEQWIFHSDFRVDVKFFSAGLDDNQYFRDYIIPTLAINKNGDSIVVSEQISTVPELANGYIRLFKLDNNEYNLVATHYPSDRAYMGVDVSISDNGNIVAVSSRTWRTIPNFRGRVEIYEYTGSSTLQQLGSNIFNPRSGRSEYYGVNSFGEKIQLNGNGDRIAISRFSAGNEFSETARAHVDIFDYELGVWVHKKDLLLGDDTNRSLFRFDPHEETAGGADKFSPGYRKEYSSPGFDIAMSSDGKTVAFGVIDRQGDKAGDGALSGAILSWKEVSEDNWIDIDIIIADFTIPRDSSIAYSEYHRYFSQIGLGGILQFSSDGSKLMASEFKSVSVYEYTHVGYGNYSWVKEAQVDVFACPPKTKMLFESSIAGGSIVKSKKDSKIFDWRFPITDASMSHDGAYVTILKNNYRLPYIGFTNQNRPRPFPRYPEAISQQAVYKIDYSKPLSRFDKDALGNYISWKNGNVSCKDLKYQSTARIDEDSLGGYRAIDSPYIDNLPDRYDGEQHLLVGYGASLSQEMSVSFFANGPLRENNIIEIGGIYNPTKLPVLLRLNLFNLSSLSFGKKGWFGVSFSSGLELQKSYALQFDALYDSDNSAKGGVYEIKKSNNYESDWHHYCFTIGKNRFNPQYKIIRIYIDGELAGEASIPLIKFVDGSVLEPIDDCYIKVYSLADSMSASSDKVFGSITPALDDIRVFNKTIEQGQVARLASHRVKTTRHDTYYYDYLGEEDGVISLEFNRSTFKDVPISSFCSDQPVAAPPGFGGCDYGTECVIDAEIKFCYESSLPNAVPVFGLYASGISGVGFVETNSPPHLQLVHGCSKEVVGIGKYLQKGLSVIVFL